MSTQSLTTLFKALADETRLEIVRLILSLAPDEVSCQTILEKFELSQPTLSHHLNKLTSAQVLFVRKSGTSHFYQINNDYLRNCGIDITNTLVKEHP